MEDPKSRTPSVAGAGMNGDPKSLYKEARSQLKQATKPDFATRGKAKDLDGEAESADQNPVEKLIRQASISKQQNAAEAAAQGAQGTATSGLGKTAKVVFEASFHGEVQGLFSGIYSYSLERQDPVIPHSKSLRKHVMNYTFFYV